MFWIWIVLAVFGILAVIIIVNRLLTGNNNNNKGDSLYDKVRRGVRKIGKCCLHKKR